MERALPESIRPVTCDQAAGVLELYALGALSRAEAELIDQHLAQHCETCMSNLAKAAALNAMLLAMVPDKKPSRALRHRLLASIGYERPRWGWVGTLTTILLLLLVFWLGFEERQRGEELIETRQQFIQISGERDHLSQAIAFLADSATRSSGFGRSQQTQPRGRVYLNSELGVLLIVENLPAAEKGKAYEMWLVPSAVGGTPRPAGIFESNGKRAVHMMSGPLKIGDIAAVRVTLEPATGSPAPSSAPLFTASVN
jgi:hypothetical protein